MAGNVKRVVEKLQRATATTFGTIKLGGDIGGTADSPRVVSVSPETPIGVSGGGTGSDLSATGPGALVQATAGAAVTVETLNPARGGTGVNNGTRTLTIATNGGTLAFSASGKTLTVAESLTLTASAAGFILTVPATGTVALLATANVFTAAQRIDNAVGINVAPSSTVQFGIVPAGTGIKAILINAPTGQTALLLDAQVAGASKFNVSAAGQIASAVNTAVLGGFTLTVPATGTAALLATANAFTAAQTVTTSNYTNPALKLTGPAYASATDILLALASNLGNVLTVDGGGNLNFSGSLGGTLSLGGNQKLALSSTGVDVTGNMSVSGGATLSGTGTTSGLILNRLTTTQRDALTNTENGQIIYNTTAAKFQGFAGGVWTNLH